MSNKEPHALPGSLRTNPALDSWVRIDPAETITLFSGKVEIGQGLRTALAAIGAEELDVEIARVRVEMADSARAPSEFLTAGSQSIEDSGMALRHAAAEAKAVLLELAAQALGVAIESLSVNDGVIHAAGAERSTSYWALMGGKRFARNVSGMAQPKARAAHRVVGGPRISRIDLPGKVFGAPAYVHDMHPEGLLHGRVLRGPRQGARLIALDSDAIEATGIRIVRNGSFVGVIAEREEQAERAIERLRNRARYEEMPQAAVGDLEAFLRSHVTASFPVRNGIALGEPVPRFELPKGCRTLEASYVRPYQMHASLGPSAALARFDDGQLTVFTHSQGVGLLAHAIADVLGLRPEQVRAIHAEGAGCYGHNGADDVALDAALLARAVPGRPVLLKWTRAQEHAFEPFGSAMLVDMKAALGGDGTIDAWSHEVYSATHVARSQPSRDGSSALLAAWELDPPRPRSAPRPFLGIPHMGIHRNAEPLYHFRHSHVVKHFVSDSPLRTSALRGLGTYGNVFAIESFMDELALLAGCSPLEMRLRHLPDPRARAVLETAAAHAGLTSKTGSPASAERTASRGQGLAFARYKNQKAYVAIVLDIEVDPQSLEIRPLRAVIACDAGEVIDPDGLKQQLEGGLVQALSWTLLEQVHFEGSAVQSLDWVDYPILRFDRIPEIECVLLDRPNDPPLGAGEACVGPTPAALANAIFDAVGVRLRTIPFTQARLRAALLA